MAKLSLSFQWTILFSILIICFSWIIVELRLKEIVCYLFYIFILILILYFITSIINYLYEKNTKKPNISEKAEININELSLSFLNELYNSYRNDAITKDEYLKLKGKIIDKYLD